MMAFMTKLIVIKFFKTFPCSMYHQQKTLQPLQAFNQQSTCLSQNNIYPVTDALLVFYDTYTCQLFLVLRARLVILPMFWSHFQRLYLTFYALYQQLLFGPLIFCIQLQQVIFNSFQLLFLVTLHQDTKNCLLLHHHYSPSLDLLNISHCYLSASVYLQSSTCT